jgi:hypothetical protein
MNNVEMSGYKRISKKQARKLYDSGKDIRVVPCKYRPDNEWIKFNINNTYESATSQRTFDKIINDIEYYNCCYETGYYAAFYIK